MKKVAFALVVALSLVGCKARQPDRISNNAAAQPKGPAPDFDLENVAGGKTKAAELKGKVLVIDFWATWCPPCIAEIPNFNNMADEFQGKDVQIVGIAVQSPHDEIKPMVKKTGMKYTALVGNDALE